MNDRDLNSAQRTNDLNRYAHVVATDNHVHAGVAEPQIAQLYGAKERGQGGIAKPDFTLLMIKLQSERCLQEQKGGSACPGLG